MLQPRNGQVAVSPQVLLVSNAGKRALTPHIHNGSHRNPPPPHLKKYQLWGSFFCFCFFLHPVPVRGRCKDTWEQTMGDKEWFRASRKKKKEKNDRQGSLRRLNQVGVEAYTFTWSWMGSPETKRFRVPSQDFPFELPTYAYAKLCLYACICVMWQPRASSSFSSCLS